MTNDREVWDVEVTDTYGGEANYSWVWRYELALPPGASRRTAVRAAKRIAGWAGVRCRTDEFGDEYWLHPYGACMVMFVTFRQM